MTRFRLTVEFDGRPFMGWQRQAHGSSVQAAIEDAAKKVTGEDVVVYAAGRTDAGVHATAQIIHVDVPEGTDLADLAYRLNRLLDTDLRVLEIELAPEDVTGRVYAGYCEVFH